MASFFINRPIVAIVISVLIVLGGLVAMSGLPVAQFPDLVPPLIQIQGSYPGADALTIEQSVATPIEQQMNGVEDSLYIQSVNASDGTVTERVTFDVGTDRNADQVNAQNRVSQAAPSLPPEVNQFGLTYRKTQGVPPPPGQEFTYTVRAQGRLSTPQEFSNIVVCINPDGSVVRLGDVARVELGALSYKQIGRFNGQPASVIGVYQAPGSNALAVAKGVRAQMEKISQSFPEDLKYAVVVDTTAPVDEGIREIVLTLLEALAL